MEETVEPELKNAECVKCDSGPILVHGYMKWGDCEVYFCKCLACGYEHVAIDGPEADIEEIVRFKK